MDKTPNSQFLTPNSQFLTSNYQEKKVDLLGICNMLPLG